MDKEIKVTNNEVGYIMIRVHSENEIRLLELFKDVGIIEDWKPVANAIFDTDNYFRLEK